MRCIDSELIQWLPTKFPTQRNRELSHMYQGKFFKEQGILTRNAGFRILSSHRAQETPGRVRGPRSRGARRDPTPSGTHPRQGRCAAAVGSASDFGKLMILSKCLMIGKTRLAMRPEWADTGCIIGST